MTDKARRNRNRENALGLEQAAIIRCQVCGANVGSLPARIGRLLYREDHVVSQWRTGDFWNWGISVPKTKDGSCWLCNEVADYIVATSM